MSCTDTTYDNRHTCVELTPSSCVPYTGTVSINIKDKLPCKPNINDVLKEIQLLIDIIKAQIPDNTLLNKECLNITPSTVTQLQLNQLFITELCILKNALTANPAVFDPNTLMVTIDLLCLATAGCPTQPSYSLLSILNKLVAGHCALETRVKAIETLLNI